MLANFRASLRDPVPLRFLMMRWLDQRFGMFSYLTSLELGSVDRPWYGYPLLHSAWMARKLGHKRISAIEFGVAGGNGLVSLERHAERVTKETGVEIAIYGFDTGRGMPQPQDVRDIPYLWQAGDFAMDEAKLRARLKAAKLQLGLVEDTVAQFFAKENPSPIAFISFDMDYYSSTMAAFKIFEADHKYFLPRVTCYFDDLAGGIIDAYNEFTGEVLAIADFNAAHADMKIGRVRGLRHYSKNIPRQWHEQIYVAHRFAHPDYGRSVNDKNDLALRD
jgi:hypothetical protein